MPSLARLFIASACLAAATGPAWSQAVPIKPGLWQMHMERDDVDMSAQTRELQERMKNMSPEMRQQMQSIMKQRGISMDSPGEVKVCLTEEQLSEGAWRGRQEHSHCKTETSRSGNTWKFHSSCPAPNKSETDGEAVFASPESYTVNATTTSSDGPKSGTHKMMMRGKWLGADCGDIKPIRPPKAQK